MAELVDAPDLGSGAERRESSSLLGGTKIGVLAELVEGAFLLRRYSSKNCYHWFESNTLRQNNVQNCEYLFAKDKYSMDYKKHYFNLISRSKNRNLEGRYLERHHILPKCLGGTDDSPNIALLTPEEHFTAHLLLIKIYPKEQKLVYAAIMMRPTNKFHNRGAGRSNKLYGWLKRRYFQICKQRTGDKNGSFGTKWISNPDTGESLKISENEELPVGFMFGRNLVWKKCTVCNKNHLNKIGKTCSAECSSVLKTKISQEEADALLFDYESGMPMSDILKKYNRKSEQSVSTFLRKRFPGRKKFLPGKREIVSVV